MCELPDVLNPQKIKQTAAQGTADEQAEMARLLFANWVAGCTIEQLPLDDRVARRWLRAHVLPTLRVADATELADRLIRYTDDFHPSHRDRTTGMVVRLASMKHLRERLIELAGSNASAALWERLAGSSDETVIRAAREVMDSGSPDARETALHVLALDPYGPQYLDRDQQNELLRIALADDDPEIRGLAAEVLAADMPEIVLRRAQEAPVDASERVRVAYWRVAFAWQPVETTESAAQLALDHSRPLDARRSALLALGEHCPTREASPVLQALLRGENHTLANDAAQIMWRHHRAPDVATAAAESPFPEVRELAERLLHPERGSPAAGGSRPGDPTRTADILQQIGETHDDDDSSRR